MRTVELPSGENVPALGQGNWGIGEWRRPATDAALALQLGLGLGLTLIDTVEMYGDGGAEKIVADAIAGRRDEVFLVSKVLPENASRQKMVTACEQACAGSAQTTSISISCIGMAACRWPRR